MQPHKRAKKGKVKTSVLPHSGKRRTIIKKEEQEPIGNGVKVSQRVRYIMVKEGPCRHCGIETTPLWRNGPSSKPVLCNACGSRWRTRGTLHDYVPKHAMIQYMSGLPASASASASSDSSKSSSHDAAGPSEPNFRNVPKRRRSNTDQIVLTAVERLNKQLYDIMHENPEVFLKEKRVEDVLINRADGRMSTQPETALGAMLLDSEPRDRESVSSSSVKTSDASNSQGNGGNGDNSPENGGNGGDQGESSFT